MNATNDLPDVDIAIADFKRILAAYRLAVFDAQGRLAVVTSDLEQERRENARLRWELQKAKA